MSQKRAYVKSVRNATATSDIFTDEDAPPDDEPGQPGAQHARTQAKPTSAPKATAVQIRDLSDALVKAEVGTTFAAGTTDLEKSEQGKKQRLGWVAQMLEDEGLPKVAALAELDAVVADKLIEAAKAKRMPRGW